MAALQRFYQHGARAGRAPEDLKILEAALRWKRSPEEIKRYPEEVLALAEIYGRDDLEEFSDETRWPLEDRRRVLMVWKARTEAAKNGN